MRLIAVGLTLTIALAQTESLMAAPCPLTGPVSFPLEQVVAAKGTSLSTAVMMGGKVDFLPDTIPSGEPTEKALEGLSIDERDVWLLGTLHWDTLGSVPILGLYVFGHQAPRLPFYLETLDRRGLTEHARILRAGEGAFDPSRKTPLARYNQWSDGSGRILDEALDDKIHSLSEEFLALPDVLTAAAKIVEGSPDLAERYEAERSNAPDDKKHAYMMGQIWNCVDAENIDRSLAALPLAQQDIVVADGFNLEMLNGGVHQFFYNSTGDQAPQVVEAFERMGLPVHAQAVRDGMAMFPEPYPVDRKRRLAVMDTFSEADNEALNALTGPVDDGMIFDGIKRVAEKAGIWPE